MVCRLLLLRGRQGQANGYWRKKHKRVFAAIFDTREEADASKYRAVYNYVMARCPKTSVAVMAERHRAAIELANDPGHQRDQRHAAREAQQLANDPDTTAAAKRLKKDSEEAERVARCEAQFKTRKGLRSFGKPDGVAVAALVSAMATAVAVVAVAAVVVAAAAVVAAATSTSMPTK